MTTRTRTSPRGRLASLPPLLALGIAVACSPTIEDPFAPADTLAPGTGGPPPGTTTMVDIDDTGGSGTVPATCGNGTQDGDETDVDCGGSCEPCDAGQACVAGEDCSSEICTNQVCQGAACGDGVVQDGEECDEGAPSPTCNDQCVVPGCGNGVIDDGEDCDDGRESATCNADCSAATCGDGVLNPTAGEDCDAGSETIDCNADCTMASCGDGYANAAAGEECDEGGDTITCDGNCSAVLCGDGYANAAAAEECDDMGESATCDDDCTTAVCGDGTINATAGEECEGGMGCDAISCQYTGCFPDPVALAMAACTAEYTNCVAASGGVVGYDPPASMGSNCGTPLHPWRFYCTVDEVGTGNYNCSPCTVGQIMGPHDPCNCTIGSSPVLGMFCSP